MSSLAVVSGTVAACNGSVDRAGLDTNVCEGGQVQLLVGLSTKVPVDYIELRGFGFASAGTACASAKDVPKCKQALADANATRGIRSGQAGIQFIVFTRGDEVGTITDAAQLRDFLSFANVRDAAALAYASGHDIVCDENNAGETSRGWSLLTKTGSGCGEGEHVDEHRVTVSRTGELTIDETVRKEDGDPNCAIGRRPEGLGTCSAAPDAHVGTWFAQVARLEAASVIAFERLAEELHALGAPVDLVSLARASAADEVRHARVTAKLARRFGGIVERPEVEPRALRSLFEVVRENAVEGQVRETFGALVATAQEARAADPDVRAAMRVIANDETRHSALSWEIAAWAEPLLTNEERAAVSRARLDAARTLRDELHVEPGADVQRIAGVPSARAALAMFDAVNAELWAA